MYLPDFFKFLWLIILKDTTKWSLIIKEYIFVTLPGNYFFPLSQI